VDPQGTTYEAKFQDGSLSVVREVMVNQGVEVFYKEMLCLARLHHRHIVALRGYSVGHRRSNSRLFVTSSAIILRWNCSDSKCGRSATKQPHWKVFELTELRFRRDMECDFRIFRDRDRNRILNHWVEALFFTCFLSSLPSTWPFIT